MLGFKRFPNEIECLRELSAKFNLIFDVSDDNSALMIGTNFAVNVSVDREGVRYWYIDLSRAPDITEYALDFFVVRQRRFIPAKPGDSEADNITRVRNELREACEALKTCASDILSGDRAWINEYTFGTSKPVGDYRKKLLRTVESRRRQARVPA